MFVNFLCNTFAAIAVYCYFPKKPALNLELEQSNQLCFFEFYIELTLITLNNDISRTGLFVELGMQDLGRLYMRHCGMIFVHLISCDKYCI